MMGNDCMNKYISIPSVFQMAQVLIICEKIWACSWSPWKQLTRDSCSCKLGKPWTYVRSLSHPIHPRPQLGTTTNSEKRGLQHFFPNTLSQKLGSVPQPSSTTLPILTLTQDHCGMRGPVRGLWGLLFSYPLTDPCPQSKQTLSFWDRVSLAVMSAAWGF